ncbi:MAG: DUF6134 family protein [Pseudomonadota bacterium]
MIERRRFLTLAAGLAATAPLGLARAEDGTARRVFRVLRDGSDIGTHVLSASRTDKHFEMAIDIDIRVKLLGITAYRYTLKNREVWDDGILTSIDSEVDDDGDTEFAKVRRAGDMLEVDGSGYSGTAPLDAVPTSYYARPFIERRPWLSTQSGKLLTIDVAAAPDEARTFNVKGELETTLIYDAAGEWVGCRFDAGGEPGAYEIIESNGAITPLWQSA